MTNSKLHVVIAGTTALDTLTTPFGKATETLGGSAVYAGLAARLFSPTGIVSIAGVDFPPEKLAPITPLLNLTGLAKKGQTFRWTGRYEYAMDTAITEDTQLGSLSTWKPSVPDIYQSARVVFIGNLDPKTQHLLLDWAHAQHPRPYLMLDTMNYWIEHTLPSLKTAIERVDCLVINDTEARMLTKQPNLVRAGQELLEWGPQSVILKKGEHGALLFSTSGLFAVPGYPLSAVTDPTGAGDSFAGTIAGYLGKTSAQPSFSEIVAAVRLATVVASFTTETLGTERLLQLTNDEISERMQAYERITQVIS